MLAATGIGALGGHLFLATRSTIVGLGWVIALNATMFGVSVIVFAFSQWLWLSLVTCVTSGFGLMAHMAASNTIVQTVVNDDKRSRVMGFYTMSVLGMAPIGSLLAAGLVLLFNGVVARWTGAGVYGPSFGARYTVAIGGVLSLAGALYFMRRLPILRKAARPMLEKAGVLPPIASGLQSANQASQP